VPLPEAVRGGQVGRRHRVGDRDRGVGLLGGAVLTETVFNLSGVGRILYDAITARDYGIVQAFTVVIAIFFVILNLLVDISYAYLDPRIRLT
jgi:peptide/nickel transport system permease protein